MEMISKGAIKKGKYSLWKKTETETIAKKTTAIIQIICRATSLSKMFFDDIIIKCKGANLEKKPLR